MKKKTMVSLIAIAAIALVVMFSGCIGSKTPIHDIYENPDNYVDKEVTITASTSWLTVCGTIGPTYTPGEGFGIQDIGTHKGGVTGHFEEHAKIWVKYSGNTPQREDFEGKWGESVSHTIRVKGMVRYGGRYKNFYIEGESWEYID